MRTAGEILKDLVYEMLYPSDGTPDLEVAAAKVRQEAIDWVEANGTPGLWRKRDTELQPALLAAHQHSTSIRQEKEMNREELVRKIEAAKQKIENDPDDELIFHTYRKTDPRGNRIRIMGTTAEILALRHGPQNLVDIVFAIRCDKFIEWGEKMISLI